MNGPESGEPSGLLDAGGPAPDSTRLGLLLLARLRPIWPWLVLAALTWAGWYELKKTDVATVEGILRGTDGTLWLVLLGVTAVNLAVFGLYDVVALGRLSAPPSPRARWGVGVVSFAWSNFLTVGPLAGPALRLWLYRPLGVSGTRARAALTMILAAFTVLLLAWCVAATLPLPGGDALLWPRLVLMIPLALTAGLALRLLPRMRLTPPSIRSWEGSPLALAGVAAVDWIVAWSVFHLAVSGLHGSLSPALTLRAFFAGQLVGLISFIPGGLGSADTYWLMTLGEAGGGHERILAALVLYRLVYYVLPWAFATLVLTGRLVPAGRRMGAFIRTATASYTFLCGAILLISAATPSLADRALFLRRTIPLALVEVSHGLSVVLGFLLLVISRGLARGYRSSHRLALAFFMAGTVTTFLKGLDFEEAFLSLSAVAILLIAHRPFTRVGRLRPPAEFVVSVAAFAILLFAAVGFGSEPGIPDVAAAFSRFGYLAHGPRFLRALMLLASLAAVVVLHFTLRSRVSDPLPSPEGIGRALDEARAYAASTNPMLVASGDKAIFRPRDDADGFISYRTAGRFLVAFSDPVGPPRAQRGLLHAFLSYAAEVDRDVILYQITPALLPAAHDFGFTFFKLGEEALVDLSRFDLKGNKAKKWRHAINAVEKAGGSFTIVERDDLARLMPELRRVSDEWLAQKHVAEKRFSIGRFDERYLMRFPAAIVKDATGRVVAFANILEGPPGEEMSVDLMRYGITLDGAGELHDVMDYLFLRLMLIARERGFRRFNLGMAPLAAVGEERWARPFEKLAHFFFRHGEQWYNYQGLRQYKEKFDPIWEPRYMAYPRPWDWPLAVTSTAALIAGGWRSLFSTKGETS